MSGAEAPGATRRGCCTRITPPRRPSPVRCLIQQIGDCEFDHAYVSSRDDGGLRHLLGISAAKLVPYKRSHTTALENVTLD